MTKYGNYFPNPPQKSRLGYWVDYPKGDVRRLLKMEELEGSLWERIKFVFKPKH